MTSSSDDKALPAARPALRVGLFWLTVAALAVAIATWLSQQDNGLTQRPPLPHQAYVWQRQWRPEVAEAIRTASREMESFSLLAAEMQWQNGAPPSREEMRAVRDDYMAWFTKSLPLVAESDRATFQNRYCRRRVETDPLTTDWG